MLSAQLDQRMPLLNTLRVFADLSSKDKKYRSDCLPYFTEVYVEVEKTDCLKVYLNLCSLQILQILLGHR